MYPTALTWNNTPAGPGKWRTTLFGLIAASPLRLPGKVYRIGRMGKRPKGASEATGPSTSHRSQHKISLSNSSQTKIPGGSAGSGTPFPCKRRDSTPAHFSPTGYHIRKPTRSNTLLPVFPQGSKRPLHPSSCSGRKLCGHL